MPRRRKESDQPDYPVLPPDFAQGRKTRKSQVEYLFRQRIKQGPGALFDSDHHHLLYPADAVFLALIKLEKHLKKVGRVPSLSVEENKFMHQFGDRSNR